MTASTNLTPRERQNLRDACLSGLVPCSAGCKGDRTRPEGAAAQYNADRWVAIRAFARIDRAERVAAHSRQALSLAAAARDAGLVPHTASQDREPFGCDCVRRQRVQRDAAALVQWERNHPFASPDRVYHLTAWATAR